MKSTFSLRFRKRGTVGRITMKSTSREVGQLLLSLLLLLHRSLICLLRTSRFARSRTPLRSFVCSLAHSGAYGKRHVYELNASISHAFGPQCVPLIRSTSFLMIWLEIDRGFGTAQFSSSRYSIDCRILHLAQSVKQPLAQSVKQPLYFGFWVNIYLLW